MKATLIDADVNPVRGVWFPVIYDVAADNLRAATQSDLDMLQRVASLGQQWMKATGGPSGDLAAVARGDMSEAEFVRRHLTPKRGKTK